MFLGGSGHPAAAQKTRPAFSRAFPRRLPPSSTAGAPTPKRKLTSAGRAATSPVMGGIYRALLFELAMLAALPAVRAEPARLPILHLHAGSDAGRSAERPRRERVCQYVYI